ncbi:MAG: carbohydrate-binding domain-containing protein [Anaerolineales bacterium]|nr:carbohydrate-binding domain-containing protein [Anaerolineales bacterium]
MSKKNKPQADENEPNAAIFSKANLTFYGNGSLTVDGNYQDGIASQDGLIIASGALMINAIDDGMRGKDYLVVKGGNITINAQSNGLKSDNGWCPGLRWRIQDNGRVLGYSRQRWLAWLRR